MAQPSWRQTSAETVNPFSSESRPNAVVSDRDRAALRRMRLKAVLWCLLFAGLLVGAVVAYMRPAYPWLASGAFVALIVALTYVLGWMRGARQLAAADAGDAVACRYTLEGPVFGSVEWWWSASPVVRRHDRGRLAVMGGFMLALVVAFAALAWIARGIGPLFVVASVMLVAPPLAMGVTCFAFLAHPSAGAVRWFTRVRWGCWLYLVVCVGVLFYLGREGHDVATVVGVFAVMGTLISSGGIGIGAVAASSLQRPGTFAPQRARIDADLRRMAASDPQSALDDAAMSRVNRRRERRNLMRAALGIGVFLLIVAAEVLIRYRFHG